VNLAAIPLGEFPEPTSDARALCQDLAKLVDGRVSIANQDRIAYARDCWPKAVIWTRAGLTPPPPDVIVWPTNVDEVVALVRFASSRGIPVIPYGAGSGVCGGTLAVHGGICLDMKRMSHVGTVDREALIVEAETGVVGENFERQLARQGFTLGHFPSSIYCSTLGGWLAARSAGQCSNKYGKIEDMVASVTAVLGTGEIAVTPERPDPGASLAQLLVGSEGTLGVITKARLFVHPTPPFRSFRAYRFKSMAEGAEAIRRIFWAGVRPAVVRLYDPFDTFIAGRGRHRSHPPPSIEGISDKTRLHLQRLASKIFLRNPAGMNRLVRALDSAMLVLVFEGEPDLVAAEEEIVGRLCSRAKDLGPGPASSWMERRYSVSYGQSKIFDAGAFADTMEVAATWDHVLEVYDRVRRTLARRAFVMAHLSHAYVEGCSLYFTFASAGEDTEASIERYDEIWRLALQAAIYAGATVSHHHGVGLSKAQALRAELGHGFAVLEALKRSADPTGVLNPGKLGLGPEPDASPSAFHAFRRTARRGDEKAGTVAVNGADRLREVEEWLVAHGLTLGPLPSHVLDSTVAQWLEGPWEGLRAIPGGRLETAALSIETRRAGFSYQSVASPRSASGPDLDWLILGRRGGALRVDSAVLRAMPLPEERRLLAGSLSGPREAAALLRTLLRREVSLATAQLRRVAQGVELLVRIDGSRRRVHRDAAAFGNELTSLKGHPVAPSARPLTSAIADHEVSWADLPKALDADADIYRIARESVEVLAPQGLAVGMRLWPAPSAETLAPALAPLAYPFREPRA
jgi:alkyldihydroxyacetonephosphate synthase